MRIAIGMLSLRTLALVALPHAPEAAHPARLPSFDCRVLAAQIGTAKVWQTTFWAWRTDDFGHREEYFVSPCFANEANCKAWLYWARSDWDPNYVPPQPCRRGASY